MLKLKITVEICNLHWTDLHQGFMISFRWLESGKISETVFHTDDLKMSDFRF